MNNYQIKIGKNKNGRDVYAYSFNNENNKWELSAVPLSYSFERANKIIERIYKEIDKRVEKSPYKYPKNIKIELIEV